MSIFDKVKQSLDKGITTVSVKSKELMESTKIKTEMETLKKKKISSLEELGSTVYVMVRKDQYNDEIVKEKCKIIAELDSQIDAKNEELKKLYVETQEALGQEVIVARCSNCFAPIVQGAKFCGGCGTQIDIP